MIKKISVYTSNNYNPYKNLAKEKILFDRIGDDEAILYLWQNKNTVVIGKNQNAYAECNCHLLEEDGGYLARRLSGGGAVFHDMGNLNFTFISSQENHSVENNLKIISLACKVSGIETEVSGRNDILANGRKFSGNAFYNSRGKSYHHGTILVNADSEKMSRYLTPSAAKLEAKGVKSVRSRIINLSELNPELTTGIMKENLMKAFEEFYGMKAGIIEISENEELKNLADIYSSHEYLFGTQPPFDIEFSDRFDWGSISVRLSVEKGIIKDANIYTDSMDWTLPEKLKGTLVSCPFNPESLKEKLCSKDKITTDIMEMITKEL